MEMGVAGTIGVIAFNEEGTVNRWLQDNADKEIIDIKFASNQQCIDILIIFRKSCGNMSSL